MASGTGRRVIAVVGVLLLMQLGIVKGQSIFIGNVGVGKTSIMNAAVGANFPVSSSLKSCTIGNNAVGDVYDMEGFGGVQGSGNWNVLNAIFEIIHKHGSIQNIIWVNSCMDERMPEWMSKTLTSLKEMNIKFNLIVHTNKCNGFCGTCRLKKNELEKEFSVKKYVYTVHRDNNPHESYIDWSIAKVYPNEIFKYEKYPVSLPSNYRDILNKDNYEQVIKTWVDQDCEAKIANVEDRMKEVQVAVDAKRRELEQVEGRFCTSNAMKPGTRIEQRNVSYKCGRYCKTKVLKVCVDHASTWCNRVEEYAVPIEVPDLDQRELEISACKEQKAMEIANLEKDLDRLQKEMTELRNDESYNKCYQILGVSN